MKIKYIKVNGANPTKQGHYFIKTKNTSFLKGDYFYSKDKIWQKTHLKDVEYWLQPVPDREEEMREMLEELVTHHFDFMGCGEIKELQEKAKELLNELKQ